MPFDPISVPDLAGGITHPVTAPLTRAAIFLVTTLNPGTNHCAAVRTLCGDLGALVRAVGVRDLEGGLSCVLGFGSGAWDQLFGPQRPAMLHPFREIRAGARHAVSTPGDLLFHIRSKRMDLCFELATQIMVRLGEAVSPVDEVQGFHYFDDRDLIGFVDGTENPQGQELLDAVLIGAEDPAFAGGSYVIVQKYFHDLNAWSALPTEAQNESSAAPSFRTLNWTMPSSPLPRTTPSPRLLRTEKRSRFCATTCHSAGPDTVNLVPISLATAVRHGRSSRCSRTCLLAGRLATTTGCSTSAAP